MQAGGTIQIVLHLNSGRVESVDMQSTRHDVSEALFRGRTPKEVISRMKQTYSLCGTAQTIAACEAVEMAFGTDTPAPVVAARDLMRLAEMATQIAMRLCLHLPKALGMAPVPGVVQAAMALETELAHMFGGALASEGAAEPAVDMDGILKKLENLQGQAAGLDEPGGLYDRVRSELQARGWLGFGALPEGVKPEQGAFRRRWDEQEVADARKAFGAGLLARIEAGFCDLAALPDEMRAILDQNIPPSRMPAPDGVGGQGRATVETARGALTHLVDIRDGRIASYQIAAPTEDTFAPGGPVEVGLLGASDRDLETAARLHVLAIDPCVEFTIKVHHA